jgi:hypothetical protein
MLSRWPPLRQAKGRTFGHAPRDRASATGVHFAFKGAVSRRPGFRMSLAAYGHRAVELPHGAANGMSRGVMRACSVPGSSTIWCTKARMNRRFSSTVPCPTTSSKVRR